MAGLINEALKRFDRDANGFADADAIQAAVGKQALHGFGADGQGAGRRFHREKRFAMGDFGDRFRLCFHRWLQWWSPHMT